MIYFADNDALLKLAAWNLLEETLQMLSVPAESIYVLPTFVKQLEKRKPKWVNEYGTTTIERALKFTSRVSIIMDEADDAEVVLLSSVQDLDAGEAILFSATGSTSNFCVVTGDKRCLRAIHLAVDCSPICDRLRGNVIHLEQIVLRVIEINGLNFVRERVRSVPSADKLISGAFGKNWNTNRDDVCAALLRSIRQLYSDCGELLQLSDTERSPF